MKHELLDWIDIKKLSYFQLARNPNPNAIHFLEQNPEKIKWSVESAIDQEQCVSFLMLTLIINYHFLDCQ
jgi:hypothetical protein